MKTIRYGIALLACLWAQASLAESANKAIDPISWRVISQNLSQNTQIGGSYHITYQLTSNLPFPMPTPLNIAKQTNSTEFTYFDNCHGVNLLPGASCTIHIVYEPTFAGEKRNTVNIQYGNVKISLPTMVTSSTFNWVGVIGVDYNPNHYNPNTNPLNSHDTYYVGMNGSTPITNTYAEMSQLKAAGYQAIRSYQTYAYIWIDIINQASALGLPVVYEAVIPQNGSQTDITNAVTLLNQIITAVGTNVFKNTVVLIFAGHENYSNSDIGYLISAVNQLQAAVTANGMAIPVGSALVSGNLVTPPPANAINPLISSYSAAAPLSFDPYPFQWGVAIANSVSSATTINAIAWDYLQVVAQSFYTANRPILMAETGWASQGSGQYQNYYCYAVGPACQPSEANEAAYLSALYTFVQNASNNAGALVFEAYDEPAKNPAFANDAENFYGVFDQNCNLKGSNDLTLIPNSSYSPSSNHGCQGFVTGALLVVNGIYLNQQPAFTVAITNNMNLVTGQDAVMTVTVPNIDRTNQNAYPWPYYLVFDGANIEITGSGSGTVCNVTVSVNAQVISFGNVNCSDQANQINCGGSNCTLTPGY